MEDYLQAPTPIPACAGRLIQRGLWVNGQPTLFALFADLCRYTLSDVAGQITCRRS